VAGLVAGNAQIDNITLVTADFGNKLYRFTTYASSPAKTDITPSGGFIGRNPYALGASGSNLSLIGTDDNGFTRLFESTDAGASWTDRGLTPYVGCKRSSTVRLLWGTNQIDLTDDGLSFYQRFDTFGGNVGTGEVRGVLLLV
jgi:hypothetical protein